MHRSVDRLVLLGDALGVGDDAAGFHRVIDVDCGGVPDQAHRRVLGAYAQYRAEAALFPARGEAANIFFRNVGFHDKYHFYVPPRVVAIRCRILFSSLVPLVSAPLLTSMQ
ncbi:hypothetical protein SDC9_161457 [bioreactor metagenome]|uniref:Uncharacterized protein n=1 Tax=bioreactor metagenome TaxID=1076179 RepID=A0A645FIA8_9ZZZZ